MARDAKKRQKALHEESSQAQAEKVNNQTTCYLVWNELFIDAEDWE